MDPHIEVPFTLCDENDEQPSNPPRGGPNIFESSMVTSDPVKEQKRREQREKRKKKELPAKKSGSIHIRPSMGTRIDLRYKPESMRKVGDPLIKYAPPKSKKQIKEEKERRKKYEEEINFCKYDVIQVPSSTTSRKVDIKLKIPSPEPSSAKVMPTKPSMTPSDIYPPPQEKEELELKKPKSGIIINETKAKTDQDYDSFDLVYARKSRPTSVTPSHRKPLRRKKRRRSSAYGGEEVPSRRHKHRKKKRRSKGETIGDTGPKEAAKMTEEEKMLLEAMMMTPEGFEQDMFGEEIEEGGGDADEMENYLTKQFRRKVSQISRGTSYQSRDLRSEQEETDEEMELPIHRLIQKFRRDSEVQKYGKPKKKKLKRGTLESHSFTKLKQPTLKAFYFGSKCGSMHQGDEHFPESARNKQGICMSIAAYCYSLLVHPNKWTEKTIDAILEAGNDLFTDCSKNLHIHEKKRELTREDMEKYCYIGNKKIRFTVSEPEISGMIRSDDKTVFNLTKGLNIFFSRNRTGILQADNVHIALWKDRHFYFFDAAPRTRDLFPDPHGFATMANFYDVPSIVTVLLERSNLPNMPFVIYALEAYKIYDKDEVDIIESEIGLSERSNYNILDDKKAVVVGSFDLGDKCFDFTRKKQALAMAAVCLVYSRITPPSAWLRRTVDKILIIGNQLYLECVEAASIAELTLDNLPATFTIGPYLVEIYIYADRVTDLMFRKGKCQFRISLEEFLKKNTNGIVQIGKNTLAIWKQRNMFYCFDPYSRNNEGMKCRDGGACVSMHSTLDSLVDLVTANFEERDVLFRIHSLKVCKIHRDPAQESLFPKNMNMTDYPAENFKKYKMVKSSRPATEKPVTVDYQALAVRRLAYGESPESSILEVGSRIESLTMAQIPPMLHKALSRTQLRKTIEQGDLVADLDSPSLSDTQIEQPQPLPAKDADEVTLHDLESFELTQEEIEMQQTGEGAEGAKGKGEGEEEEEEQEGEDEEKALAEEMERMAGEGEAEADWYMAMANFTQVGSSIPGSKISIEINTDLTYFQIPREVLYPTSLRGRQEMMMRMEVTRKDSWFDFDITEEPKCTQSEELKKETNFVDLPDDTQLLRGTTNIANFGEDLEFMAPFICIMAITVSKKYAINTWSSEIVDYVLKCGTEVYKASKVRYDQVSKLEIPKIALGKTNFSVRVNYLFDTYMKQNIVELALDKILFARADCGILVTPSYACAVFKKNHLFYLYDGFGNNEVGLSEGPRNTGTACFARFKNIHALASRIMYNKTKRESHEQVEYTRFVISTCQVKLLKEKIEMKRKKKRDKVKEVEDEYAKLGGQAEEMDISEEEQAEEKKDTPKDEGDTVSIKKEAKNKVGYQKQRGFYTISGTKGLSGRRTISDILKEDHFTCLCASLLLLTCPVSKWDTKKVDKILEQGAHVYSHAEDLECSEKRVIKNALIDKNYFDIIVKQIKIMNWNDNRHIKVGIDTLLKKKHNYFLIQFPNCCFVLHKTADDYFHLFDPYGCTKDGKPLKSGGGQACWIRFKNLKKLKRYIMQSMIEGGESYVFYNFEVTSISRAPKKAILEKKIQDYELVKPKKGEVIDKPFYEDITWLEMDPVPWSRRSAQTPSGQFRDSEDVKWHDWVIEYPRDLYSLTGNLHQNSEQFSPETRGKQTLANLVVAMGMTDIYNLSEWTAAIVDSILVNGDTYLKECIKDIKDPDYELAMDDLKEDCSIFPYTFKVDYRPVVQGMMFIVRMKQFNLYKALRYFFEGYDSRFGIIIRSKNEKKRQVGFGKVKPSEYFMFDCEAFGPPMFSERRGVAYVLRTTTLNRLLHVLTLTLRGGEFFIYEVEITDLAPIN